ncbi:unnamed protein product [Adineta ricciae]|uniref:Uncharacterized protein n=1 Tax=Adineta ricciae TaxID=249248 RepID=A0A816FP24_ADIRI|nr:unnamed protein product [Adineta ricciae]CAF1664028.1 unnamed protein product [Adineta ricciae]
MSATSSTAPTVNPALIANQDYHTGIQPYFLLPIQFLFYDFSLRFWDKAVYNTWFLPGELIEVIKIEDDDEEEESISTSSRNFLTISTIYILQELKKFSYKTTTKKKVPTFDLFDVFFSVLPLLAHTIWYCIVQSSCES